MIPPDPAEGVWEDGSAVVPVVAAIAAYEFVIIFAELEGVLHLKVCEPPVAEAVIEIAGSVLEEDSDVSLLFLPYESGVDVAAFDVGEAADVADDFMKKVGPFPGGGEGADATGAGTADGAHFRIGGNFDLFGDFGKDFLFEELGVFRAEDVIFIGAVPFVFERVPALAAFDFISKKAGIYEDSDGHGHFAARDEVIHDDVCFEGTFRSDVGMAILEDNDGGFL